MTITTRYTAEQKYNIIKYADNHTIKDAINKYRCSEQAIYRWKNVFDGSLESLKNRYRAPYTQHPNAHTEQEIENIKYLLKLYPYISHKELYEKLKKEYGYTRHPGGLYNFLRRNKIFQEPKLKNDYATMFDELAVKRLNKKFLYNNNKILPLYVIEINDNSIFIAKGNNSNPCNLTVYYSTALRFKNKQEAVDFIKHIKNTSKFKLAIKELI